MSRPFLTMATWTRLFIGYHRWATGNADAEGSEV